MIDDESRVIAAAVVVTFFLAFILGFTCGYLTCVEDFGVESVEYRNTDTIKDLERGELSEKRYPPRKRRISFKLVSLETGLDDTRLVYLFGPVAWPELAADDGNANRETPVGNETSGGGHG